MYNLQTNSNRYACNICICIIILSSYNTRVSQWPYHDHIYYIHNQYITFLFQDTWVPYLWFCMLKPVDYIPHILHIAVYQFSKQINKHPWKYVIRRNKQSLLFLVTVWHYSCRVTHLWWCIQGPSNIWQLSRKSLLSQAMLLEIQT